MSVESTKLEDPKDEGKGIVMKLTAGFALLSILFWRGRKTTAEPVRIRKAAHSVPRSENQSGRMEKA